VGQFESFIGVNFWTALFVLLNTLIIFWVAKKFLFVPVRNLIAQRQNEIDEMYSAADQAKTQAQALENEYRGRLTQAQETSDQIVKDAVARGQRREAEIVSQASAQAAAIKSKATAEIALEKEKAINDAKNEISDIAMAIAGKVVGRAINDADQTVLVDHFIDELGDKA
jgi:F-type H+-transporting ATPase subunit b